MRPTPGTCATRGLPLFFVTELLLSLLKQFALSHTDVQRLTILTLDAATVTVSQSAHQHDITDSANNTRLMCRTPPDGRE